MKKIMKRAIIIFSAVSAVVACADFSRSSPPRKHIGYTDMKIRLEANDRHGFVIHEDAFFGAKFAVMDYPEYHLNWAEYKQLAVEVAKTVANYLGSTNDIRICHWEQPKPADTNNIGEAISAWLKGDYVTDEIVPRTQKGIDK